MKGISTKVKGISAETSFFVLKMARDLETQGRNVVHLEMGEPDFDTPESIKRAAVNALMAGETHYTPSQGISELRQALAQKVLSDYGVEVSADRRVAVTVGAKQAIYATITTVIEPGDEVICPNPGYQAYEASIVLAGGRPVYLNLTEEDGFKARTESIADLITSKTRMIVLNSPANPCGSTLDEDDAKGISELAAEYDLYILSDEIYKKIIFDGAKHFSPFAYCPERTFLIDGFSKTYAMTGWRVGYVVAPEEVLEPLVKMINIMTSCPTSFAQRAAITAFSCDDDAQKMLKEYDMRRDLIHRQLSRVEHVTAFKPSGTFYIFVNVKEIAHKLSLNSEAIMNHLLHDYGVAVLQGSAFGTQGEGYLRLSFANSPEKIVEGVARFQTFINDSFD